MQLSSFYNHNFLLGHSAMNINEGIPKFIIKKLEKKFNLIKHSKNIFELFFTKYYENDNNEIYNIIIVVIVIFFLFS